MRIMAIDPGSRLLGTAVLSWTGEFVEYVAGGHCELGDQRMFGDRLDTIVDHVILETIQGHAYSLARVPDMVLTARMEGRILALAEAAGLNPMTVSASEARGQLCKSPSASDAQIALVVESLVLGAPVALRKTERKHIYDACLYGLVGLSRLGARLTLPPAAEMALHVRRKLERATAARKGKTTKAARAAVLGGTR